ncbi:glycosyltransferase family 2 protein [Luminiphilus sp.]|nr:glycosyltransferase family 2 protein [Luminiphilus sp.]
MTDNRQIPELSIVVPLYHCEVYVEELYDRLTRVLNNLGTVYEIIFVNDASPQADWTIVNRLARQDSKVIGVNLSRNFGQHHAITAGLDLSRGEWIVVMDGDLQDQPEEIPKLYETAKSGSHVVLARREHRNDSWSKKISSSLFYRVLEYFTEEASDPATANFGIYSRTVTDELIAMREQTRSFPLAVKWLGFEAKDVSVEHSSRKLDGSSYTLSKLMRLALDIIIARSNKPLHLSIQFGFMLALGASIAALYLIYQNLAAQVSVPGWTSIMVTIVFIGGLLFANMGLLGIYLGKIYEEVKARPLYVIKEIVAREPDN